MKTKASVTNAMRLLKQAGIEFETLEYDLGGREFSAGAVAEELGIDPDDSFKTLCARGNKNEIALFVIAAGSELDLKKAAKALNVKSVSLVHVKELLSIVGYERGSVSPVGTKKAFPVFIDENAMLLDRMIISGGKKGISLRLEPERLREFLNAVYADIT